MTVTPVSVPSDERDQSVSYTLSPSTVDFALVSIDSSTGQVSISSIADLHGSQVFTVTADDGQSLRHPHDPLHGVPVAHFAMPGRVSGRLKR